MSAKRKKKNRRPGPIEVALTEKIEKYISRHRLLHPGDRVMVAVSGGPDSVAMLCLLSALRLVRPLDLTVIHLDHGLRGEDSRCDAEWVRGLAAELDLPARIEARSFRSLGDNSGYSPEEAARVLRYRFFHDLSEETGIDTVALGHHADDQAETVLLKLLRGSRPGALGAMHPLRREGDLRIVRPILELTRNDILAYLDEIGRDYREDRSNRDDKFTRNRIRRRLLPLIEKEYNPAIRELLVNLASQERARERFISEEAGRYYSRLVSHSPRRARIDLAGLARLDPVLRDELLRTALTAIGLDAIDRRGWFRLFNLIEGRTGRQIDLPGGWAMKSYEELVLFRGDGAPPRDEDYRYRLEIPGEITVAEAGASIAARIVTPPPSVKEKPGLRELWKNESLASPVSEYLDYDRVTPPLSVRPRRPGDRYRPLGAPGSRKLKEIMIDEKLPRSRRPGIPLVLDRDGIVLAAGYRPAHRCRLTGHTRRALEITLRPFGRQ